MTGDYPVLTEHTPISALWREAKENFPWDECAKVYRAMGWSFYGSPIAPDVPILKQLADRLYEGALECDTCESGRLRVSIDRALGLVQIYFVPFSSYARRA